MKQLGRLNRILAIAILASGTVFAAPAKALDGEEVIGVIIGLAALAAISNELRDDKDDEVKPKHHRSQERFRDRPYYGRDTFRQRGFRVLPEACLRRVETARGHRNVLGIRCLERNGIRTARLPERCERNVLTRRGDRVVFGARCLRNAGYEIGRRSWR